MNKAVKKTVDQLRQKIAAKPQDEMFRRGELWEDNIASIASLSTRNIARLRAYLGRLSKNEASFVTRFEQQPFYATHFTSDDRDDGQTVKLLSRKNLQERNIAFNTSNTQAIDLKMAAHDDHVFFALEVGSRPQKTSSRFGGIIYRFSLQQSRFRYAWISLNDMVKPKENNLRYYFPNLLETDYVVAQMTVDFYNTTDFVFTGAATFVGVALSIVHLSRRLSSRAVKVLLSATTQEELNKVLNGLFRPEMKLSRFLITSEFQKIREERPASPVAHNAGGPPALHPGMFTDRNWNGYDVSDYFGETDSDGDSASVYSQE